ncbi:hypothetical protein B0F90DRAFT_1569524, partial [Multifurca ochricompacta]
KAVTTEEKEQYKKEGRCFECGRRGHLVRDCPTKGPWPSTSTPTRAATITKVSQMTAAVPTGSAVTLFVDVTVSLVSHHVFISPIQAMKIFIPLYGVREMANIEALVDSGATENFINYRTVIKYQLPTKRLAIPKKLRNADGTPNATQNIDQYAKLDVITDGKLRRHRFYIASIGTDQMILGYPW